MESPEMTLDHKTSEGKLTVLREMDSNDEDDNIQKNVRRNVQKFSDSDSESEKENDVNSPLNKVDTFKNKESSDSDDCNISSDLKTKKSRIRAVSSSEDEVETEKAVKNEEQQVRMLNKKNKLKNKFKGLLTSRKKETEDIGEQKIETNQQSHGNSTDSNDSNDEARSIEKIKQKIKERTKTLKSTIYDPDTSDEESMGKQMKSRKNTKNPSKSVRMSAKQAMDNMHKIKSESNRMLREKDVSLPYHRPKAFTLKDIMNRRKPNLTSDGKALPIKMNEEQLKQYDRLLQERQKEIIEMCKSDSENDEENNLDKTKNSNEELTAETCHEKTTDIDLCLETKESAITSNVHEIDDTTESNLKSIEENSNSVIDFIPKPIDEDKIKDVDSVNDKCENEIDLNNEELVEETNNKDVEMVEPTVDNQIHNNSAVTKTEEKMQCTEDESQIMTLHFDSEKIENNTDDKIIHTINNSKDIEEQELLSKEQSEFSDDDMLIDDIDKIIEDAELEKDKEHVKQIFDSPMLMKDVDSLKMNPKLSGAPGMVIDLDGSDPFTTKKSGVELLKERFTYFSKIKTPEELEREKEKRIKPGMQYLKLKHELEEKIADQRSIEWAKRLEDEKQQRQELEAIRGDGSDVEDDIDKIEAKLDESNIAEEGSSSESEEELEENDCDMTDKRKKRNPMVDDEAEESDDGNEACDKNDIDDNADDDDESSDDTSSESEDEESKPRKGRILKAFEDSDDEDLNNKEPDQQSDLETIQEIKEVNEENKKLTENSQDDEIQLAQMQKSFSEDLFTSQESDNLPPNIFTEGIKEFPAMETEIVSQFSILDSNTNTNLNLDEGQKVPDNLEVICSTQPCDTNLDAAVGMCSGNFATTQQKPMQSQEFGDDILALCTGKFYDNQFVSLNDDAVKIPESLEVPEVVPSEDKSVSKDIETDETVNKNDDNILKSIIDELDGPDVEAPKLKYFTGNSEPKRENEVVNTQIKKRLIIDSDDEDNNGQVVENIKKKKLKKKKPQQRALQISDDEEEVSEEDDYNESDIEDNVERLVEYDSEENEVEVVRQEVKKKKRKVADFFEQEAELTSEDEWVGSGDEDERGLDRMEREQGDDDTFNQGKLQAELGQIHMREVFDQDKREVRILQELLFEDGDLGDGHRQRKFRWKDADGGDETEPITGESGNTQEEEFESEEMWRKQRHEREMFLRQMQQKESDDTVNVKVTRMSIIKANLNAKSVKDSILDISMNVTENMPPIFEKKSSKDIPSPKKPYAIFQHSFHGSILARGKGSLDRLAALAMPLAGDDDVKNITSKKRNFVFAAINDEPEEPKLQKTKRKAEANAGTPRLVKKMRTEDKQKHLTNSLLDHLKV